MAKAVLWSPTGRARDTYSHCPRGGILSEGPRPWPESKGRICSDLLVPQVAELRGDHLIVGHRR